MKSSPASGIRLNVSTIIDREMFVAGQVLSFEKEEDVPEHLRRYIKREDDDDTLTPTAQLNYRLGERYDVDDDGRLHTALAAILRAKPRTWRRRSRSKSLSKRR